MVVLLYMSEVYDFTTCLPPAKKKKICQGREPPAYGSAKGCMFVILPFEIAAILTHTQDWKRLRNNIAPTLMVGFPRAYRTCIGIEQGLA